MFTLEEDGWLRDIPFLAVACLIHGIFLSHWTPLLSSPALSPIQSIPVEFVAEVPKLPAPTPALAPVPQAPSPVNERPASPGPLKARARPSVSHSQRLALKERRKQALRRAQVATALRREAAHEKALQAQAERYAQKERRAATRIERARQRAEISQQLATMVDPDENLVDAPNESSLGPVVGSQGPAAALLKTSDPVYEGEIEREGYDPSSAGSAGGGGFSWSIEGPVGNRRIIGQVLPKSPAWVSQRGLELSVQIKFQVLPEGSVKPGAVIQRTSGFPEIDRLALEAIRRWRFEATPPGPDAPQVWGRISFRFLMG